MNRLAEHVGGIIDWNTHTETRGEGQLANKGKYPPGTACIFWGRRFRTEQLELREALQEVAELAQDEEQGAS